MTELAKAHSLQTVPETTAVEASPFIHEGGQFLAEPESGYLPAEQVRGLVARFEGRMDGLVTQVTDQASEVNELTRVLEAERRGSLTARHRLQVAQLEAENEVQAAVAGTAQQQLVAQHTQKELDKAEVTIAQLKERLELAAELRRTPWYAFKRRKALEEALHALPADL